MATHRSATFEDVPYIEPNPLPPSIPKVDELGVTSAPLKSASFAIGEYCKDVNEDFMLCKQESRDPAHCLKEGRKVTRCAQELVRKIRDNCNAEFERHWQCLEKNNQRSQSSHNERCSPSRFAHPIYPVSVLRPCSLLHLRAAIELTTTCHLEGHFRSVPHLVQDTVSASCILLHTKDTTRQPPKPGAARLPGKPVPIFFSEKTRRRARTDHDLDTETRRQMAAQDASTAEETAPSLPLQKQDETRTDALLKGDERVAEPVEKVDFEEKQADLQEYDSNGGLAATVVDGTEEKEIAPASEDSNRHQDVHVNGYLPADGEAAKTTQNDSHPTISTAHSSPRTDQADASSLQDGRSDAESSVQAPGPRAASLQTTSAINRTSSPAYSQSSVTSGQGKDSVASPSIVSTAPKKFSTVNINKKFLGKTGSGTASSQAVASGASGNKDAGLGLVNLSARPSSSLTQQQSSSRILTSAKLTSVIPSKPSSATGGLTAAPAVGWAKSTLAPSVKNSPSSLAGAVLPRSSTPVNITSASGADTGSTSASSIRQTTVAAGTQPGTHNVPFSPSTTPSLTPSLGIRLTNQGPSAARHLTSLTSVKQPVKRGWQTISSTPDSSHDVGAREIHTISHGPFGQARYKQTLADDFPTAMEVIAGRRSAVVQAQQAAQAKAAHNQAILEGLNAFRGTNKDPNAHHWDEEDDEDLEFPQALDFGDGTTYTLPVATNNRESDPAQATRTDVHTGDMQQSDNKPVSKQERFAKDDFDRSWPPKPQYGMLAQDKGRANDHQANNDHLASTRTLYNARLNKMEPSFERPTHSSAELAPTHILPRSGKDAVSQTGVNTNIQDKQAEHQPLERQVSRDRPWGRVQPPVIGTERNPWARRRPSETDHSRTWGPPHVVSDHQPWSRGSEAAKLRQPLDESRTEGNKARSPEAHQSQLQPLFSQSHAISAAIPTAITPSDLVAKTIDITEIQKDEMHRAAEQARLRRQQEEAEREAQKERARQKAKELAEREMQKETPSLLRAVPSEPAPSNPSPYQKEDNPHSQKVIVKRPEHFGKTSQNPLARPPPSITTGQRRPSEKRVAFEEPVLEGAQRLQEAVQRNQSSESGTSSQTASLTYGMHRDSKMAQSLNIPPAAEPTRPFSAFFDPLAESSHVNAAEVHFDDLSSLSNPEKSTALSDLAKFGPEANARFNLRPELLQAESWRKSTRGQEVVVPGVIGSSREYGVSPKALVSKPIAQTIPDTLQTTEELLYSPPTLVTVTLPKLEQPSLSLPAAAIDELSLNANVGSAFDTVLARLQSAMTLSNDSGYPQTESESRPEINVDHAPIQQAIQDQVETSQQSLFLALPRPNDFLFSMIALPPSPGPAWKRYTIRLPKSTNLQKPVVVSPAGHRMRNEVPAGWVLSWDPPFEQLGRNLSRDEWLLPKTYHRGKPVTMVKLPTRKFEPYIAPQEDRRPGEASSVTSQAPKEESHRSGARKIIVKLPTGKARSQALSVDESETTENGFVREEFQTSSEIPLLSPVSSSENLPSAAQDVIMTLDEISGSPTKVARKVPEGLAMAFARPHDGSFSEDADAKSSVRFMVSSEIEDDNLLSEVNKMSMDGLTENPAAEDLHVRARDTEPRSPGRKLPNREHLMNVWSHLDGDRGSNQQGNAFRPMENDVPSGLVSSVQDLKETNSTAENRAEQSEVELDMDLPRYPSIHGAPPANDSDDNLKETIGQNYSNSGIDTAGDYQAAISGAKVYDGYQYATLNHMAHSPSNMPSAYSARSPVDIANSLNGMSSVTQQHGVWLPLQQAPSIPFSPGMNSHGSSVYGAHGMSKSPGKSGGTVTLVQWNANSWQSSFRRRIVPSGYDGTPILSNAGINLGQMSAPSVGGMYSHPSGPLDSPTVPYIRPSGYSSQPGHLSGMPNLYSQGGPYVNNGRDMYGMNSQYGHRGNMNQPMLPVGSHDYSGRFQNSNTNMNRPFGGFNGGPTSSLSGSRYNPGGNGFGQSTAHGSQQQRMGLGSHGKMGSNPGRKVW
ncbi:hypothetical protein QFC19_006266 [Naganishia cerealis]|uniref:Uncharacterized protein n=1 Tax=Naganishia cerealis TaxID=610337 RepID=A0ACC2VIG8_9TREE|nr:hypothetical protein QFC19_006266 [Naganishia cerealis]